MQTAVVVVVRQAARVSRCRSCVQIPVLPFAPGRCPHRAPALACRKNSFFELLQYPAKEIFPSIGLAVPGGPDFVDAFHHHVGPLVKSRFINVLSAIRFQAPDLVLVHHIEARDPENRFDRVVIEPCHALNHYILRFFENPLIAD